MTDPQNNLSHLNEIKNELKKEINNSNNFLNITIKDTNRLKHDIYRKPTFTDSKYFPHPRLRKLAAYRSNT